MKNVKLTIAYDGTRYSGWQRQINARTIQGEVEKALKKLMGLDITIHGSGRTDAGVHALGQVASFEAAFTIPVNRIPIAVNTILPDDIVVINAEEMPQGFHARYYVKEKKYRYKIYNNRLRNPIHRNYSYHIPYEINMDKLIEGSKYLIGEQDFSSFMSSGSSIKNTIRKVYSIDVYKQDDFITLDFRGNGFLYNMVRIMTGTLLDIGGGKLESQELPKIIGLKNRKRTRHTAPAQGLYLIEVVY